MKYHCSVNRLMWPLRARDEEQNPVQRVGRARLRLAEHGLAVPVMRVPQRELAVLHLARFFLEPGEHLLGEVGPPHPVELHG